MSFRPPLPTHIGTISSPACTVGVQAFGGAVHPGAQRWRRGRVAHVLSLRLRLEASTTQVMSVRFALGVLLFSLALSLSAGWLVSADLRARELSCSK